MIEFSVKYFNKNLTFLNIAHLIKLRIFDKRKTNKMTSQDRLREGH